MKNVRQMPALEVYQNLLDIHTHIHKVVESPFI